VGSGSLGDSIKTLLHGPRAAVARFLNQLTYFEMKNRAGVVGTALGSIVLPGLRPPSTVRLHLIGHSFGARLVTAAASRLPTPLALQFFSLTLLQGAFSHNALAAVVEPGTPGAFANVIQRPIGPITITYTHNDRACTFWYPLASRLSRDIAKGFGDKDDIFGAMGANGAQKLATSASVPDEQGQRFAPQRGKVNGFLADSYIVKTESSDAHNNITNPVVGKLVAAVLQS
jgi:pimeloyl-ACP methyl ester carboxylesterase